VLQVVCSSCEELTLPFLVVVCWNFSWFSFFPDCWQFIVPRSLELPSIGLMVVGMVAPPNGSVSSLLEPAALR
jgi:hypothetical protein